MVARKFNKNRMSISEAALLMGASQQFVRVGLQNGIFSFGYAQRIGDNRKSGKYTYYINRAKFQEETGIDAGG